MIQALRRWSRSVVAVALAVALVGGVRAAEEEVKPADPAFAAFHPVKAPAPGPLLLQAGDQLAIVGDSITEQCMYSRLLEDYLTMCRPDLKVAARQFGWSGETASGFLRRMTNDCLRFKPTVATLCYGMNDYGYRPFEEGIGKAYRTNYTEVVKRFKAAGARVVLGSPGCVGKVASWVKPLRGTLEEHNLSLCTLRNIDIEIAAEQDVRFADVYWPMLVARSEGKARYGEKYEINGNDGVHPGWAGQLLMAYAFLRGLGFDGDLGTFTLDLAAGRASASAGHTVDKVAGGEVTLTSSRYPFCVSGAVDNFGTTRSGASLVPFNQQLNRLRLVVTGAKPGNYAVTWGEATKTFAADALAKGINLADEFPTNPFSAAFAKVDSAISAKQSFERDQVKGKFHSAEARADMDKVFAATEEGHKAKVEAVAAAFVPVTHTLKVVPAP